MKREKGVREIKDNSKVMGLNSLEDTRNCNGDTS